MNLLGGVELHGVLDDMNQQLMMDGLQFLATDE